MSSDFISEIKIDEEGKLHVSPKENQFPYIYREALEVNWNKDKNSLYSPVPKKWSYLDWFKQIIGAARSQSCELSIDSETEWVNISEELKKEIIEWCGS